MSGLRVAMRADASLVLGSGHVMRCLTLAEALRAEGAQVQFICRALPGHLGQRIQAQGFGLLLLPGDGPCDAATDARQALAAMAALATPTCDWLLVDHYALAADWQRAMRPACRWLMVIDDLADRPHAADLLLDQNLGRQADDYLGWLPPETRRLIGPRHALLRPEFAAARSASLARRAAGRLQTLLISMGGADPQQATLRVLQALAGCALMADLQITVVLGAIAHTRPAVQALLASLPWRTQLCVDVADMAALLQRSDLAIGAAGGSAWERCCLGVPTLQLVLAENQRAAAGHLAHCGAARSVSFDADWASELQAWMARSAADGDLLRSMSRCASLVTDGNGTARVLQAMHLIEDQCP